MKCSTVNTSLSFERLYCNWCLVNYAKFTERIEQKVCTTLADITRKTYCGVYRFDLLHHLKMASVFVTVLEILRSKTIEYFASLEPKSETKLGGTSLLNES